MRVEKADASALLATGWRVPEAFVAKGRDGTTDIYGVIVRPTIRGSAPKRLRQSPSLRMATRL